MIAAKRYIGTEREKTMNEKRLHHEKVSPRINTN